MRNITEGMEWLLLPGAVGPHGARHEVPGEDVVAHTVTTVQQDTVHAYTVQYNNLKKYILY